MERSALSLLLLGLAGSCLSYGLLPSAQGRMQDKKCKVSRVRGLVAADCNQLNLQVVPDKLRSDLEAIDLEGNRIREIDNSSFINYESLKMLFLKDNMIHNIDAGTFEPLSDLEVLDLSWNSLHMVPEALTSLPVLKTLYLGSNPLITVVFQFMPSLQYLSLDNCKLSQLPMLATLPSLQYLNVSTNKLKSIDIHQVAPLCRLEKLDLQSNSRLFRKEHCSCHLFSKWVTQRSIIVFPAASSLCKDTLEVNRRVLNTSTTCFTNATRLMLEESEDIAKSCEVEVLQYGSGPIRIKGTVMWALVAVGFCLVVLVCFFSTYCLRKRRRKKEDHSNESLTSPSNRS